MDGLSWDGIQQGSGSQRAHAAVQAGEAPGETSPQIVGSGPSRKDAQMQVKR